MKVQEIRDVVISVAPLYPVVSVDLFGSFASGDEHDQSDIDLLVCFDENTASLFDLLGLKFDIQDKLNKRIDVVAGPLKRDSTLTIKNRIRLYDA